MYKRTKAKKKWLKILSTIPKLHTNYHLKKAQTQNWTIIQETSGSSTNMAQVRCGIGEIGLLSECWIC